MTTSTKKLDEVWKHIETANREMGVVQTEICWIKKEVESIKTWQMGIMAAVAISIISQVFLKLLS